MTFKVWWPRLTGRWGEPKDKEQATFFRTFAEMVGDAGRQEGIHNAEKQAEEGNKATNKGDETCKA